MSTFLAFRLEDNATYPSRYSALMAAVEAISEPAFWAPATSFVVLELKQAPLLAARQIKAAIDPATDVAMLCMFGADAPLVIGDGDKQTLARLLKNAIWI